MKFKRREGYFILEIGRNVEAIYGAQLLYFQGLMSFLTLEHSFKKHCAIPFAPFTFKNHIYEY